jgi:hypothetical protein
MSVRTVKIGKNARVAERFGVGEAGLRLIVCVLGCMRVRVSLRIHRLEMGSVSTEASPQPAATAMPSNAAMTRQPAWVLEAMEF